jgi:imidazole glycerol-phosphate synthase subunit HisF
MFRPRIIPVLLLSGNGLVKTIKFNNPTYIGDPINAVKIFNDLGADELVFLDINATREKRTISKEIVRAIGDEAFMPFSVGGGIVNVDQIGGLLSAGAEKVVINTGAFKNLQLVREASERFGNQSIIVSIDIKRTIWRDRVIFINSGKEKTKLLLEDYLHNIEETGAGEVLINSIDRDGTYAGYDLQLIQEISAKISIPLIVCGGAKSLDNMKDAFKNGASACAAGSIFVFHGSRKGVLINYPEKAELLKIFENVI